MLADTFKLDKLIPTWMTFTRGQFYDKAKSSALIFLHIFLLISKDEIMSSAIICWFAESDS